MSLRHHIAWRESPVRRFIDEHFVFQPLSRETNKELKKLPLARRPYEETYLYAVAGTAADLMIRGLFDQAIHRNGIIRTTLALLGDRGYSFGIHGGPEQLSTWGDGKRIWDAELGPETKTAELIREFERFSASEDFRTLDDAAARRLAAFCILFGRIDHARRSGNLPDLMALGPLPLEEKLVAGSTPALVEDVVALFRGFAARHPAAISSASRVATGGVLAGSADVDGADFDFVVDGCLYEIKTTIKPTMSTEMLRQCVGYWLIDYDDEFAIREIALDLPRQDFVKRLDVRRDLLSPDRANIPTAKIRSAFRDMARSMPKAPWVL